ncbi:MAG: IclR family transcriptional regulator [Alphaproteobacteria bacterium]|nr:IclR family transcriptional regulator [Alphaproteobacteria bacterium]
MADLRKGIQSIEVGFRVLECLERALTPLSLTEIAQTTGMAASKVHFYLISFARVGLVTQDAYGGRYRLGPAALRLGLSALAQLDILELARREIANLRERTGDTVFLSVWGTRGPTVVSRLDGRKIAPLEVRVGAVMPVLTSATGKSFLARLPRRVTAKFVRRELDSVAVDGAPRNLRDVEHLIADAQAEGVTSALGTVIPGILTFAAPVVDYEGAARCVVTIMGYSGQMDRDPRGAAADALRDCARAASRAAGFTGDIWKPQPGRDGIKSRRR